MKSLLFGFLFLIAVPSVAHAACPGAFSSASCNGGTGSDVGTVSGGSTVSCDLGVSSDLSGSDAKFVSASTTSFEAYGYEGDGEAFCCVLAVNNGCAPNNPNNVTIRGTYKVDKIDLNDTIRSLSLDCTNTTVYAEDDNDDITGSDLTTNFDTLYGDQNDDTINGAGGGDTIYGGSGYDILHGNAGNDYIDGGSEGDNILGNDGDDTIYGGTGDDDVCGDWGSDELHGDAGADNVFGGAGTDTNDGGLDTPDYCENDNGSNCDFYTLTFCTAI